MTKKTIRDIELTGKRVLIRTDFNVPLREDGSVASDRRIRAALPTLRHCLASDTSVVVMTHLGRPGGQPVEKLGLRRVAIRLRELLGEAPVEVAGTNWEEKAKHLKTGQVLLLENLRFDPGEKNGDERFANRLRGLGEVYVNDAFAACHREHASMFGVPERFPEGSRVIGLSVAKELTMLDNLLESPPQPMVAVLGGAKVADKIGMLEVLLGRARKVLVGGAMAFTFMKARGIDVGSSTVEEGKLDLARKVLDRAGDKLILPQDHVVVPHPGASSQPRVAEGGIPDGWYGFDIGPRTIECCTAAIRGAGTVVWSGPPGKFEDEAFRKGTEAVARALADVDAITVVGGGESGEAVELFDLVERIDHVSTGGGAFLKYLEYGCLPALSLIDDQEPRNHE